MEPRLITSINSLSTTPSDIHRPDRILIPPIATRATIDNAIEFANNVLFPIGYKDVGVSLHAGMQTNVPLAAKLLAETGIRITSGDVPDVMGIKDTIDHLRLKPKEATTVIAWTLVNTVSRRQRDIKVEELIENVQPINRLPILRTSSAADLIYLIKLIDKRALLAVEIDAHEHTLEQYLNLMRELLLIYPNQIAFAFDGGHTHEAHPNSVEALFENMCKDPKTAENIALVEITQKDDTTGAGAHSTSLEGKINYGYIMKTYRQASRRDLLGYTPHVVIETHPSSFTTIVGNDGIKYFRSIYQQFFN